MNPLSGQLLIRQFLTRNLLAGVVSVATIASMARGQDAPQPSIQALSGSTIGSTDNVPAKDASVKNDANSTSAIEPAANTPDIAIDPASLLPDIAIDPASLLPDLPPVPAAKATLVGGTIEKLDRVQDRLTLQVFGGGKTSTLFDGRTQVYRNGEPASLASLKAGERVYIDTILFNGTVFARSIRLRTGASQGESQGIVLSYRPERNELIVRDVTAPQPLKLRLTSSTRIVSGDASEAGSTSHPASTSDLTTGTLVSIQFGAERNAHDTAQQISILATPGAAFTFSGRVTFLDLHNGIIVLTSDTNHKTYEIYLDPSVPIDASLHEGVDVMAQTRFDQNRYMARSVTVQGDSGK